jgi:HK97 family phage portal protein
MWPFKRKASLPQQLKSASYLFGLPGGGASLTGAKYNELASEGYSQNSVAYACINKIATSAASIEWHLYKKGKAGKVTKIDQHDLLELIENPNPTQSGTDFIRYLVSYYLTAGNAYVFGNGLDKKKKPTELQLLNPGKVTVAPGKALFPNAFEYRPDGNTLYTYGVDQVSGLSAVMQVKTFNPLSQWYGISPIIAAAYGIDIHNSGNRWNKKSLDNDARPSGALVVNNEEGKPGTLTEEQYERLKLQIDEQMSGTNNAGKPLLLEGGLDWKELSLSPKDMDFLEGKNSAARDIAQAFGVPPQIIGITGDSTFANYEQATLSFWSETVLPTLGMVLDAFNRWLTPLYGDDLYFWYDQDSIDALEPRRKEKAERIDTAEYMTFDEKRNAMGMESLPNKLGEVLVLDGRGIMMRMDGTIVNFEGVPTDPNQTAPDTAKHRKWLIDNGYSADRAERLAKLMYS